MKTDAIVLGSGRSGRMQGTDKLLADLEGDSVIVWSLRAFENNAGIRSVVVTTSPENDQDIRNVVRSANLSKIRSFVTGGDSRSKSVLNALKVLEDRQPDFVAVHDGARPLLTQTMISDGLHEVERHAAAIPAVPAIDTVKIVNHDQRIVQSPPRSTVWHAQTPQFARYSDMLKAHLALADSLDRFTDDASLLATSGIPIQIYQGDRENLKITTIEDLVAARTIVTRRHDESPTTTKLVRKT